VVDLPGTKGGPRARNFLGPPKSPFVPGGATTRDKRPPHIFPSSFALPPNTWFLHLRLVPPPSPAPPTARAQRPRAPPPSSSPPRAPPREPNVPECRCTCERRRRRRPPSRPGPRRASPTSPSAADLTPPPRAPPRPPARPAVTCARPRRTCATRRPGPATVAPSHCRRPAPP